jgi:membrane-bound lytic murein transglycosylase D
MTRFCVAVITLFITAAVSAAEFKAFPRPPALESDIGFWTRVYSEVDTRGGLIHDARNLGVVYEVIRFAPGSGPRARARRVKQTKRHYKNILITLARGKREGLSAEEQRVLALWSDDVSNRTLRVAAQQVRFQLGQADKFRAGVIRAGAWKPHIERTFSEMGLPAELGALPHVESSFNPDAYSRVGAAGLWQFTRSTGRRYLRINSVVDERLDPFKSTLAAARLLKHNHAVTGSWPLAITAYNHGAAGIRRAARRLGTDDIVAIVRRYKSRTFGFASRNFYVAFLAATAVEADAEKFFGPLARDRVVQSQIVKVPDRMSIAAIERALGMNRITLRRLNRALRRSVWNGSRLVPRGYELRIPLDSVPGSPEIVLASAASAQRARRQRALDGATASATGSSTDETYRVRYGDSLSEIARRLGVKEQDLMDANDISDRHRIYAGQVLRVAIAPPDMPGVIETPPPVAPSAPTPDHAIEEATPPTEEGVGADKTELAKVETAEPTNAEEAERLGPTLPVGVHPALSADPSDYLVGDDNTIEVQAAETLGHYAEWLGIRASRLRKLNRLRFRQPVVIGHRLRLDFSKVSPEAFERQRLAYHVSLQEAFFERFQIAGTAVHVMRRGELLWVLSQREYDVPLWLIRQFNPDLHFETLMPGTQITIPRLEPKPEPTPSADPDAPSPLRTT